MAAQQPFYPREPDDYDRLYSRMTLYLDARLDAITNQARVDKRELLGESQKVHHRISDVETHQKSMMETLIAFAADISKAVSTMQESLESFKQETRAEFATMQQQMTALQQEMREGFAAQAERHNELMVRVERLERQQKPPEG